MAEMTDKPAPEFYAHYENFERLWPLTDSGNDQDVYFDKIVSQMGGRALRGRFKVETVEGKGFENGAFYASNGQCYFGASYESQEDAAFVANELNKAVLRKDGLMPHV